MHGRIANLTNTYKLFLPIKFTLSGDIVHKHLDNNGKFFIKDLSCSICYVTNAIEHNNSIRSDFVPASLSINDCIVHTDILIDTGALQRNWK